MNQVKFRVEDWKNANIQVFWGEIAPFNHLVQFYETEKYFLDTLEGFVGCGIMSGDSVIVLGTSEHLAQLNKRLQVHGFDLDHLIHADAYMPIDADQMLDRFMVNNWPDEALFRTAITDLLSKAKQGDRKVRAFGELVAVLWERGLHGATVQLEELWHQFHHHHPLTLYCAYPKSGFLQDTTSSVHKICKTHSQVIDGQARPSTEIYFQPLPASYV